ncbi:hypothetical protein N7I40_004039 [Vibrio parahaemolyticus]|uniref:hypothetical protein n=1 Tax=Vibrio harveyi group TaxID=717610 RepID=UPI00063D93AC|nr:MULTISPECIES: hypothetical protein [Vibrio harveyi group]EGR3221668.1 hypothetical protein [Vibrio parahaemolyticus]EHK6545782.1 hypothetical protein [Vibrio parahaemolyticus]EJL8716091.1 hypothetical protein [Vibrio alginolyticus]EJV5946413.1 hypothetical protein [Vibrio parahaemolyticus]EKN4564914.1 hypothetical protein [Vibrio parahaemolyticus]
MSDLSSVSKLDEIKPVHTLIDAAVSTNKPAYVTLTELAQRCGFHRPGSKHASPAISMLRKGTMRLPLDKVAIVADELGIDRRVLFISLLRDTVRGLIVKKETEEEFKEFNRVWEGIASLVAYTHTKEEDAFVQALREVQEEVGHDIKPDASTINSFKEMLRDQYAL